MTASKTIGSSGARKRVKRELLFASLMILVTITGCSRLAGSWVADEPAGSEMPPKLTGMHADVSETSPVVVRIREDGTFDWSGTTQSLGATLRRRGDRLIDPINRNTSFEVVEHEYSPRTSRIMIRRTINESPSETVTTTYVFEASLVGSDKATYREVVRHAQEQPIEKTFSLRRADDGPTARREPFSDLTEGGFRAAVRIDNLQTEKGNRYTLLTAKQRRDDATPLIVAVYADYHASGEDTWLRVVARYSCAVLIPEAKCDQYMRMHPDADCIAEDVEAIRDCIRSAPAHVRSRYAALFSGPSGGFVAHMIWQTDTSGFSAFLAWDSDFEAWTEMPGEQVETDKPTHIWTRVQDYRRRRQRAAEDWYERHGYNLDTRAVDESNMNKLTDLIVETLVGAASPK